MRPTIDQIADQPQHVGGGIESQQIEQAQQGVVATLNITDGVNGHVRTLQGFAGGNGGNWSRMRRATPG